MKPSCRRKVNTDSTRMVLDRDHNAAINILKKGLEIFVLSFQDTRSLPQELREVTPVEISKRSRKPEATRFREW